MDLSVIVPVYNTEKFLKRCLDSIFNQKFDGEYEVIAVDDGSTDGSLEILMSYSMRYDNLRIIEQPKNLSLAVARRTGIDHARGDYLIHVDSDDWLEAMCFDILTKTAKRYSQSDIIIYNVQRHNGAHPIGQPGQNSYLGLYDENSKDQIFSLFLGSCINKMVKRICTNEMVYGMKYLNTCEDLIYCVEIFHKSEDIVVIDDILYNYYYNISSLTNQITPKAYFKVQSDVYNALSSLDVRYRINHEKKDIINNYLDKFLLFQLLKHHFRHDYFIPLQIFDDLLREYKIFNINDDLGLSDLYLSKEITLYKYIKLNGMLRALKHTLFLLLRKL